jgi:hypothetical protein
LGWITKRGGWTIIRPGLEASVLGQHPELANERSARRALAWLVIGAPSL